MLTTNLFLIRLPILLLLLLTVLVSQGQHYEYDIVKGDKTIGRLVAKKRTKGDTIFYDLTSETQFKMIFTVTIDYDLHETHVNGAVLKGKAVSKLSGRVQRQSEVTKKNGFYEVETVSDIVKIPRERIEYSIPQIYFSEPKSSTKVFSQIFTEYLEYESIGNHQYVLHSEDGKNVYIYENDRCVRVDISRAYANFSLVLRR